ncbi:MAG: hypothetical protein IMF26_10830 [Candidatus Fermentithermobacillus carboniphilus]|uniref:Bypass of forespore C C-terminal domain-containing protein n=1 Tax=Candidatus Fermentithermobacillus carboniphilus TaxID=3085328 RepID=A0AAT9LCG9_9FIRM|nr:MAG: hypothetical protein IMF26_10830 [Candidatus Fermentithermobacillus carboniphilus]
MEKRRGTPYKKVLTVLVLLGILTGVLAAVQFFLKDLGISIPFVLPFVRQPVPETASVKVTFVTRYAKCDDVTTTSEEISRDRVESFISTISGEWSAVGKDGSGVQLLRTIDDYCPHHSRTRLIILNRGHVAVYRGTTPDPRFLIKEYPDIRESALEEKCRDLLKKGYLIEDEPALVDEKVRLYLEGIID